MGSVFRWPRVFKDLKMGFSLDPISPIIESVSSIVTGVLDRFFPKDMDAETKQRLANELTLNLANLAAQREQAQKEIIVAELNQSDNYTKRARPTIVYMGLAFIAMVYVIFPMFQWGWIFYTGKQLPLGLPSLTLPPEFWWAWAGVCGIYSIGRTMEKNGEGFSSLIPGNKK